MGGVTRRPCSRGAHVLEEFKLGLVVEGELLLVVEGPVFSNTPVLQVLNVRRRDLVKGYGADSHEPILPALPNATKHLSVRVIILHAHRENIH